MVILKFCVFLSPQKILFIDFFVTFKPLINYYITFTLDL